MKRYIPWNWESLKYLQKLNKKCLSTFNHTLDAIRTVQVLEHLYYSLGLYEDLHI